MATYNIYESTYISPGGRVVVPAGKFREIEVVDDYVPSLRWEPLDDAAKAAYAKREKEHKENVMAKRLLKDPKEINHAMLQMLGSMKLRMDEIDASTAVDSASRKKPTTKTE